MESQPGWLAGWFTFLARSTNTLTRDELNKLFSRPINYSHGEMAWQLLVILAQSLRRGCYLIQFAHTAGYKHRFSVPNLTELDFFLIFPFIFTKHLVC